MSALKKLAIVCTGAIALSVLGLQAGDALRGIETGLTGMVADSVGVCGTGAVQFLLGSHALCIDQYEASPGGGCPYQSPGNQLHTQDNLNESDCVPESQPEVVPWRFVSLTQAQQLCARVGKRLPTSAEWYRFSNGMSDQSACVLDNKTNPALTGSAPTCSTPAGIYDVVGNVWEWVDGQVRNGEYDSRSLPPDGYVSLVDADGMVIETTNDPQAEFGNDYAWTNQDGTFGIIRGGFYGSQDDGGIFAQNLAVPFDFKTAGVGFRCVRDI